MEPLFSFCCEFVQICCSKIWLRHQKQYDVLIKAISEQNSKMVNIHKAATTVFLTIFLVFIGFVYKNKCNSFSRIKLIITTACSLSYKFLPSTLHGIKHFWRLCFIQTKVYMYELLDKSVFHRTVFQETTLQLNKSGFRIFNITSKN